MQDHELIPCRNWFDPSKVHHRVLMIPNVKHASPDVHFYHHKDINLLEYPGMNVKRQVKQLIHYMRGGSQPNPAKYEWPIVSEEIVD